MPADHSLYLSREHILSVLMSIGIIRKFFVHLFLPIPIPMIKAQTHNRPMVKVSNITEPSLSHHVQSEALPVAAVGAANLGHLHQRAQ